MSNEHNNGPAAPQGWKPINTAPKDKFVLLACPSDFGTTHWVFTTGIMHSNYKVGRWVDHENDDLTEWGMDPVFWRDDVVSPDATPAPAPAQEVGLTDEEIFKVAEPFGAFQYGDAQGDKRLDFARAIIAALLAKGTK